MKTRSIRIALWAAACFNFVAAIFFAFASSLGPWVGMPGPVPRVYGAFIAMFILLFAGAYAWLAFSPRIERSLLTLAAVGKCAAVILTIVFYGLGDLAPRALIAVSGDLLLAIIFARWLWHDSAGQ